MNSPARRPGDPPTTPQALFDDGPTQPDQRLDNRIVLHAEVDVASDHNFYTGLTQDISRGGLFLATHQLLPVGELVSLTFTLPGASGPFHVEAQVKWVRDSSASSDADHPPGMGLQFLQLSAQARENIARFLQVRDSVLFVHED